MSIATAIVLTVLFDLGWRWLQQKWQTHSQFCAREILLIGCTGLLIFTFLLVPAIPPLFLKFQGWWIGTAPELYNYLSTQPKEILIASLASEADNLPAFAQRSTLVGREFSLPHHLQYYRQIRQRAIDLIWAQYSLDLSELQSFIKKYGIDLFLIENTAFEPEYLLQKDWLIHSSFQDATWSAVKQLKEGKTPAIVQGIGQCTVLSTQNLILLDTVCINKLN